MHDYLGCVKAVDESVGRLLEYLDDEGLGREHHRGLLLRPGLLPRRTRLVRQALDLRGIAPHAAAGPLARGDKARRRIKGIVSNIDFAETFLEAAGRPVPADMQGRSLVPLCKGETPADWRKSFYYHYYEFPAPHHVRPHYGVVTDRYKLVHFYAPDVDYWELYRPRKGSERAAQLLRRSGVCQDRGGTQGGDPATAEGAQGSRDGRALAFRRQARRRQGGRGWRRWKRQARRTPPRNSPWRHSFAGAGRIQCRAKLLCKLNVDMRAFRSCYHADNSASARPVSSSSRIARTRLCGSQPETKNERPSHHEETAQRARRHVSHRIHRRLWRGREETQAREAAATRRPRPARNASTNAASKPRRRAKFARSATVA